MQLSSGRYMKTLYGILVMGISITCVSAQILPLQVEYLTSDNGLVYNRIQDICEDVNGFLLIDAGAIHNYDSEIITIFDNSDDYGCISVDIDGNIIGTSWRNLYVLSRYSKNHYVVNATPEPSGRCPFVVDDRKNLWVGIPAGKLYQYRYDKDTIEFVREFKLRDEDKTLGSVNVLSLKDSNNIWIGCENGFFICSTEENSGINSCYLKSGNEYKSFPTVHSIYHDADGESWLGTSEGLKLVDHAGSNDSTGILNFMDITNIKFPSLGKLNNEIVFALQSNETGELYLRTDKAIYAFDKSRNQIQLLHEEDIERYDEYYGWSQYALYYMKGGLLWFGTDRGLGKLNLNHRKFEIYRHDPENPVSLSDNSLNQVTKDHSGNLWVGTTGKGLNKGIPEKDGNGYRFERYLSNPNDPYSLHSNTVSHLFTDSEGRVWVGAGSLQRIDESEGKVRFIYPDFIYDFPDKNTPSRVISIREDTSGNLWVGIMGNNDIIFNPKNSRRFWFYINEEKTETDLMMLFVTNDQNHYILSYPNGIYKIEFPLKQIDSGSVCPSIIESILDCTHFESIQDISSIITEYEDYKDIWTAYLRHYRFTETKDDVTEIELIHEYTIENDGKPWEFAYSLIKDDRNRIWAGTQNGLSCIDPKTKLIHTLYEEDGIPANSFYYGNFKDDKGKLYFTSSDGLVVFHPDNIRFYDEPAVIIKQVIINQRLKRSQVKNPGDSTNQKHSIEFPSDDIVLSYYQNSISVDYVAPDYVNSSRVKYKWTLHEYRQDLELTGYDRKAIFVNLKPGHYELNVTAANHNNVWNTAGTDLKITIMPPPWQTWYAYIVYGFILLGIILLYRRFLLRRAKLKTALETERIEKDKVLEIDQMKTRFFANISHEFRTPLTLILGPVEDLFRSKTESLTLTRDTLQIIRRNIKRLQRLINQLLDISKLETGNMKLAVAPGNLAVFCRTITQSFLSLAESKKINYEYHFSEPDVEQYYDADKLEKILSNLISNAFKFTPEKGSISVNLSFPDSIDEKTAFAELSVKDTGKGIPGDQAEKIFDRFYQVSSSDDRDAEGTGIGLSLTRELVELYRGEIKVESTPGKGSLFIVKIPFLKHQFKPEEFCDPEIIKDAADQFTDEIVTQEKIRELTKPDTQVIETDESASLILVVEDNSDLRNYIAEHLKKDHTLLEAENGREGFSRAIDHIPDLIITDLMMPEMDGMEMCRLLRADERTNHIPVIMLTAKADRESKLSGLKTGADDYLVKPFDAEELKIRVKNSIQQRQKLREKFRKELFASASDEDQIPPRDKLIRKLFTIFEEHLDDPDFDIEKLGSEINMSRAQVFRKINAITGNTPKELLRHFRLHKAARLFLSGHDQITQVMLQVGFNNSSYFTKCFRELYGITPSEYIKNITKKSGN